MAVDSRDKRFSMLGLANGRFAPAMLPNPDGANWATNSERAMGLYLYYGIAPESGKPTMTYWAGVPHMRPGRSALGGRSW
jgi:hypothetical protein